MTVLALAFALGGTAIAKPAASEAIGWHWDDGQTRRYYGHAETSFPVAMAMGSVTNVNAQVQGFKVDLIVSCAKSGESRRGLLLKCDIEDMAIQGRARSTSKGKVGAVAEEWAQSAKGGWIVYQQKPDGRLSVTDFGGIPNSTLREQDVFVSIRMMVVEALGSLDMQLPKTPGLTVGQTWRQIEAEVVSMPSTGVGAMGSAQLNQRVSKQMPNGLLVGYQALGQSTLALQANMSNESGGGGISQSTENLYRIEGAGSWVFDPAGGQILQSQFKARGEPTASSALATTVGAVYDLLTYTQLLVEGGAVPQMPASGEY